MAKGRKGSKGKRKGSKGKGRRGPAKKQLPIRAITPKGDVWDAQKTLRKGGYFARAVAANKLVTTAPKSVTKG